MQELKTQRPLLLFKLEADEETAVSAKLFDSHKVHSLMYLAFGGGDGPRTFLYDDRGVRHGRWCALVLSERAPDMTAFPEGMECSAKPLPADWFSKSSRYIFELVVNPVWRGTTHVRTAGTRTQAADWLVQKAAAWGFQVEHLDVFDCHWERIRKNKDMNGGEDERKDMTFCKARIRGLLRVTDLERFIHAARTGCGRVKSYGCGLLQLMPCGA